jgi:hypothetical protein
LQDIEFAGISQRISSPGACTTQVSWTAKVIQTSRKQDLGLPCGR